jgi:hypothetical protein
MSLPKLILKTVNENLKSIGNDNGNEHKKKDQMYFTAEKLIC